MPRSNGLRCPKIIDYAFRHPVGNQGVLGPAFFHQRLAPAPGFVVAGCLKRRGASSIPATAAPSVPKSRTFSSLVHLRRATLGRMELARIMASKGSPLREACSKLTTRWTVLGIVEAAFGVRTEVVFQPGDIDVPLLRAALDEGQRFLALLAGVADRRRGHAGGENRRRLRWCETGDRLTCGLRRSG